MSSGMLLSSDAICSAWRSRWATRSSSVSMPGGNMWPKRSMNSRKSASVAPPRTCLASSSLRARIISLNRAEVFRRQAFHALLQALKLVAEHLLAQLVDQVLERLPRFGIEELVVHEALQLAGGVVRQRVQRLFFTTRQLLDHVAHLGLRRGVRPVGRAQLVDSLALLGDDFV